MRASPAIYRLRRIHLCNKLPRWLTKAQPSVHASQQEEAHHPPDQCQRNNPQHDVHDPLPRRLRSAQFEHPPILTGTPHQPPCALSRGLAARRKYRRARPTSRRICALSASGEGKRCSSRRRRRKHTRIGVDSVSSTGGSPSRRWTPRRSPLRQKSAANPRSSPRRATVR